ncbi:MAG: hypothetical protein E6G01_00485 [Actinobacteria bacterium]|nr:MAG: hypothetical protein E6G01_00485 [Actinomycetota bacterium]
MTEELLVDPEALRAEVRDKYRQVAGAPDGNYHFHTGRALAARLGYELYVQPNQRRTRWLLTTKSFLD